MPVRVLMLGNSFTFYNDLPKLLSAMTGWEVKSNTKGGAFLSQQLDESLPLGSECLRLLAEEKWDYVVLQEQSNAPVTKKAEFLASVRALCEKIRACQAVPVLYATWAYREGSEKLASVDMTFAEMDAGMYDSYHEAARLGGALVADVGKAFAACRAYIDPYSSDDYHPSPAGSVLAAHMIADTIAAHARG